MKKRTSIHDIARHLGMSSTTVSFVLNSKAREKNISVDTEKRVLEYIKEIGYQPNLVAKSLRTGKSNLIAMLVESIADPFFSNVAKGVEDAAYDHGYKVFFASTENQTEKARALLNVFRERQVDGYIIAPPPGITQEIQALQEASKPVVIFDRLAGVADTNTVMIENYQGSHTAVSHLLDNGYRQIGFITLQSDQSQMSERLKAYRDTVATQGISECIKAIPYNMPEEQIAREIYNWLLAHPHLDSVYFSTNYLTLAGLGAIKNLNRAIPADLAVVSFDDSAYFRLHDPSITVVAQPIERIAQQAIESLMTVLNRPPGAPVNAPSNITLPTHLIVRDSSLRRAKKQKKVKISQPS